MSFQPFEVRLTRDVQVYFNLVAPKDTMGIVIDTMGDDPKNPDGYFVEIMTLWNDKETSEILEVPLDGIKKIRAASKLKDRDLERV